MNNPFAPRRYGELQKITDKVYIFRNITNSSFVIGDRGVAVIDTQVNGPLARELLKAVRSVTDKPILYAINTHYHWDHTNGNQIFKNEGAQVLSSALTRKFMVVRHDRQKEFLAGRGFEMEHDPLLPEKTFEGRTQIDLGDQTLRLFFAGEAESDDATAIHVPAESVLMSGDTIMTGSFPIFGQPVWDEGLQGDGKWEAAIARLMDLKPAHIVPGHGPLAKEADIARLLEIQDYFTTEVRRLIEKGMGLPDILKDLEARLPEWMKSIPLVWGTPRYAILRVFRGLTKKPQDAQPGWQRFKPSVIPFAGETLLSSALKNKETAEDFLDMARQAQEGGDLALKISILKKGAEIFGSADILTAYAESLIEASRAESSVLEKGDFFDIARKCWDRALAATPGYLPALLGKGRYLTMMAYHGGDNPRVGMKLLEEVLSRRPGGQIEAEAHFYLGMGFRRLGQEGKAKERFEQALEFDPGFMPAVMAKSC
jgi:glyoxylase-like metal-dependent hydrolase (beta-lactamase superfamily II)